MSRLFQEARDFAGADWEKQSDRSRLALLRRSHLSPGWARLKWRSLPESVQKALVDPMIVDTKELQERFNRSKQR